MLPLDQKAAKCTTPTCTRFCGKFSLFIATKSFKTRFWVKFPVAKGLINVVLAVFLSGKEKKRKSFHSKGWHRSESAHLPPMWPGFKSRRPRHMWVEFVVDSLPCSVRFFSGYSGFPLSSKTNIFKFQFDQESGSKLLLLLSKITSICTITNSDLCFPEKNIILKETKQDGLWA